MLQTFLFVAVPALVTLTAALYFLQRLSREDEGMHRTPHFQTRRVLSSESGAATNRRSRTQPSPQTHLKASRGPAGDNSVTSRRANSRATSGHHKGECVVCFEESNIVELYPCKHKDLCENCVTTMISANHRICPLCRSVIQGYSEVF
ncbi:hypothetical protein BsWGS_28619 [Bradybaena similaris]